MERRDFVKAVCAIAGFAAIPVFAAIDPTLERRYSTIIRGEVFRMTGPLAGYRDTAFIDCQFLWPMGYSGFHFMEMDNIMLDHCYLDLGQPFTKAENAEVL